MTKTIHQNLLEEELYAIMKREISFLREILSSIKAETSLLLENRANDLKNLLLDRDELLRALLQQRSKRTDTLLKLTFLKDRTSKTPLQLKQLIDTSSSLACSIFSLKEQILSIHEEIRSQTQQDNHLLESKISFTQELIRRLHPSEKNTTYNAKGNMGSERKKTTLTLINKEV